MGPASISQITYFKFHVLIKFIPSCWFLLVILWVILLFISWKESTWGASSLLLGSGSIFSSWHVRYIICLFLLLSIEIIFLKIISLSNQSLDLCLISLPAFFLLCFILSLITSDQLFEIDIIQISSLKDRSGVLKPFKCSTCRWDYSSWLFCSLFLFLLTIIRFLLVRIYTKCQVMSTLINFLIIFHSLLLVILETPFESNLLELVRGETQENILWFEISVNDITHSMDVI